MVSHIDDVNECDQVGPANSKRGRYAVTELLGGDASVKQIADELEKAPGALADDDPRGSMGSWRRGRRSGDRQPEMLRTSGGNIRRESPARERRPHALVNGARRREERVSRNLLSASTSCSWEIGDFSSKRSTRRQVLGDELRDDGKATPQKAWSLSVLFDRQIRYLRNVIHAKAYFAFQQSTNSGLATAVMQYLVASLARPTHSPGDLLQHACCIQGTGQMIYKEDKLFNGISARPRPLLQGLTALSGTWTDGGERLRMGGST